MAQILIKAGNARNVMQRYSFGELAATLETFFMKWYHHVSLYLVNSLFFGCFVCLCMIKFAILMGILMLTCDLYLYLIIRLNVLYLTGDGVCIWLIYMIDGYCL